MPARSQALPLESVFDDSLMREAVREGFPFTWVQRLQTELDAPLDRLCTALGLPKRTLARRQQKGQRLSREESERVLRLQRVFLRAADILGSREAARDWLTSPSHVLGHVNPIDLLDTEPGARQVEQILGRLEHGVFS